MKFKAVKKKLWFKLFLQIAAIFAVFVLVLALANVTLLVRFFCLKEKTALKEQIHVIDKLDFNDPSTVVKTLGDIQEKYNFDTEIYTSSGDIVYTTLGSQMMDYFTLKNNNFFMAHEDMAVVKSEELGGGVVFETALRGFDRTEYLLCRKQLDNGNYAEVRVQMKLISDSAAIANEFIVWVSVVCFLLSILWVLFFSRHVSRPIVQMNDITRDMARLNFERKLAVTREDEIGQLAGSVNELSESLSVALDDLKAKNRQLQSDIEAERQLDAMRRGFVANVSHELKTPIAIIGGYAEGLKLNVSPASREEYCNIILDESRRMNRLVLSILELSRYESGQIQPDRQTFDVSVMCGDLVSRIFAGKQVRAENRVPAKTLLYADPVQIEQIVKAYLENAAAHTPENGRVWIESEKTTDGVRLSVCNTGSHIEEEQMPQIWQSFFRGDSSHKRESSRFGLGLSIVSAIVKLYGRSCGVYNTENGVCFWFDMDVPRQDDRPQE